MRAAVTSTRPGSDAKLATSGSRDASHGRLGRDRHFEPKLVDGETELGVRDMRELQRAIARVLNQLGSTWVPTDSSSSGDIPVRVGSTLIGYAKAPSIVGALARLVLQLEREFGKRLPELSRSEKHFAVRRFQEEGALELREAVDHIAAALDVSRVTVYSYLNRRDPEHSASDMTTTSPTAR